jgi:copper chaperone NosL
MSVKDSGYAAQIIATDGKVYKFDDIGCLFAFQKDHSDLKVSARYVQDAGTKAWIVLDSAWFVVSKEVATPMSYGAHSFASEAGAKTFSAARKDAPRVLRLAQLADALTASGGGSSEVKM